MSLKVYYDTPFLGGTEVDETDTFTGDGTTVIFDVDNKDYTRVGSTIQYGSIQLDKYNAGFVVNNDNTVTLAQVPPLSAQGVIPGISNVVLGLLYDQDNVTGVANPRVVQTPFWVADVDTISSSVYTGQTGTNGIKVNIVNNITNAGASTSWCQLASSQSDTLGSPWLYLVSAVPLYTNNISTFNLISPSSSSGSTTIFTNGASDFQLGDYIKLSNGTSRQEIVRITGYTAPKTLTVSTTNYNHYVGETIYTCGRKFWIRTTVPLNATSNTAANFYNLSVSLSYTASSRL